MVLGAPPPHHTHTLARAEAKSPEVFFSTASKCLSGLRTPSCSQQAGNPARGCERAPTRDKQCGGSPSSPVSSESWPGQGWG